MKELMRYLMSSKTTQPSINKNKNKVSLSSSLGAVLFETEHRLLYTNFLPCQAWNEINLKIIKNNIMPT